MAGSRLFYSTAYYGESMKKLNTGVLRIFTSGPEKDGPY